MLTASGLSRAFGPRTLFSDASLQLGPGRRVALVGGNGTGKTTLIATIVGLPDADTGEVLDEIPVPDPEVHGLTYHDGALLFCCDPSRRVCRIEIS